MRVARLCTLTIAGVEIRQGSRVRLRPRGPGDALDLSLAGKMATIESIERDCEGKFRFAVILGPPGGGPPSEPGGGPPSEPGGGPPSEKDRRLFFEPGEIDPLI